MLPYHLINPAIKISLIRWGSVFLKQTQILNAIQFTWHFTDNLIEFIIVKTKRFVSSNVNVILTQQTCGQRSSMSAGSKHYALA